MTKIILNNNEYPIPDSKLAGPTDDFVAHLGTIAGNGLKVVVSGVEYSVDPTKLNDAVVNLEVVLSGLNSGGNEAGLAPGLYRTGAIALYEEGDADGASAMLETSWDDLVADGRIIVDNGTISIGTVLPDELPEKNEYGFYYDVLYDVSFGDASMGIALHRDGSFDLYQDGLLVQSMPAGTAMYSDGAIDLSALNKGIIAVSADGLSLDFTSTLGGMLTIGNPVQLSGDLILPNDGTVTVISKETFVAQTSLSGIVISNSVTSIGDSAFQVCTALTSIIIPDSVTSIGAWAFADCSSLTEVTFEGAIRQWNAITKGENWDGSTGSYTIYCTDGQIAKDGTVSRLPSEGLEFTLNDNKASYSVTGIGTCEDTDVVIPSEYDSLPVTGIGSNAFSDYTALTSIVIPNSITYIGDRPFLYCSNLTEATFKGTVDQWNAIEFGRATWESTRVSKVQCSDGYVSTK